MTAKECSVPGSSFRASAMPDQEASVVSRGALPQFAGLSHLCIVVDYIRTAVDYYGQLLGAEPDYGLPYWQNEGFFQINGVCQTPDEGEVSVAVLLVPGTGLTLHLVQYHTPIGQKEPAPSAPNDVNGVRSVALEVVNLEEAAAHLQTMPDVSFSTKQQGAGVIPLSQTGPEQVCFFDQDLSKADTRSVDTARRISRTRGLSFQDRYGVRWEFLHSDIP